LEWAMPKISPKKVEGEAYMIYLILVFFV